MTSSQHLSRAPIREALIDFRVVRRDDLAPSRFEGVKQLLHADYPRSEDRHVYETQVAMRDGKPVAEPGAHRVHGVFLFSSDGLRIAQFRLDGFTFNRLRPYESWDSMLPEAMRLWRVYREATQPEAVARLAVRYINALHIPSPAIELDDYLTAAPKVPEGLPQHIGGFLTRLTIRNEARDSAATITQTFEPRVNEADSLTLILDIDAYLTRPASTDDSELQEVLEDLRRFKNQVFFASVTERTLELFR